MQKYVYHGSTNGNLKKIVPFKSTHLKKYVYATTNPIIALAFAVDNLGDLDFDLSIKDKKVIFTERRKDSFNKYNNGGYLYTLDAKNFKHYDNLWEGEVASIYSEKIISSEYIPNIINKIKEYEKSGEIIVYRYPNKPDFIPKDDSDLVDKYINFEKIGHKGSIDTLIMYYPQLKETIFKKLANPSELYYVDKKKDSLDNIIANDNLLDAICRNDSEIWKRDNGWVNYNIVNSKFIFEKGGFNFKDDFYVYKVKGDLERLSAHSFKVKNTNIISIKNLDLTDYVDKEEI